MRVKMRRKCIQTVPQQYSEQKECVMKTATTIQENAEDIYEEAKEINAKRASEEEEDVFEEVEEVASETCTDDETKREL